MNDQRTSTMGFVQVKEFISDASGIGIKSILWPNKREITVYMDMETEKAKNPRRPSFESLHTQGEKWRRERQKNTLEPGGMLRMRLYQQQMLPGVYTTDWPNVLTWNLEETQSLLRFGTGLVKVYTPQEVSAKRNWLTNTPEGMERVNAFASDHPDLRYDEAIEQTLSLEMHGFERYKSLFYLYEPEHCITGTPKTANRAYDSVVNYFSQAQFTPFTDYDGLGYRPVKPHLIVRSLDKEDRILACHEFMPRDGEVVTRDTEGKALSKRFLTPNECADKVMPALKLGDHFDILPCQIYPGSMEKMRMGEKNNIVSIRSMTLMSRKSRSFDENGFCHPVARQMGIKLAHGGSCVVVDSLYDIFLPACEPMLLRDNEQRYTRAETCTPEEEQREQSQNRSSMRQNMNSKAAQEEKQERTQEGFQEVHENVQEIVQQDVQKDVQKDALIRPSF